MYNLLSGVSDLGPKRLEVRKIELALLPRLGNLVEVLDLGLIRGEVLAEPVCQLLLAWEGDVVLFDHQILGENWLVLLVDLRSQLGFTDQSEHETRIHGLQAFLHPAPGNHAAIVLFQREIDFAAQGLEQNNGVDSDPCE